MPVTQRNVDELTHEILGCAIKVHKELGPGLLESIYEKCLAHLLKEIGFDVKRQQTIPLLFHGLELDCELRYDLLINDLIVVEIKSCDSIQPIHQAQLLTYLKLLKKPKGIIINFNCANIFRDGQRTFVTEYYRELP